MSNLHSLAMEELVLLPHCFLTPYNLTLSLRLQVTNKHLATPVSLAMAETFNPVHVTSILTPFSAGPEVLMYLHALSLKIKPRWMRVYGFVWPIWMTRGSDHWSCDNFAKLPDILPTTITDEHQVFIQQLLNLYVATMADNPLTEFWNKDTWLKRPPKWTGKGKIPADDAKILKDWQISRVNAMAAALKPFFTKICGQSLADLTAPNQSIVAIMNGTTARLKEVRATNSIHEWQIHEEDPKPPLDPPQNVSPPPGAPTQPLPDSSKQEKRKIDDSVKGDTPDQQAKVVKVPGGAPKQEDDEALDLNFPDAIDADVEGDYAPGVSFGASDVEDDSEILSDYAGSNDEDEEMPTDEEEEADVQDVAVQNDLATPIANTAPSSARTELLFASTPEAPISGSLLPIRAATQAPDTVSPSLMSATPSTEMAVADEPPPAAPSSPFYLCGSDFTPFAPDSTQAPLPTPSAFSDWVANLNNGYIVMANAWVQPKTDPKVQPPPAPQAVPANIHPADEWFQRIYYNGLGIQQVTFLGYVDTADAIARVTRLSVQLDLLEVAASPTSLTFSSDASSTVSMGATAVPSTHSLGDALMPDYGLLALGLQKASETQLTVGQIISYFGMAFLPIGSTGGLSLPGFDPVSSLTTTLDMSPGSRSSLSFKPDVLYSTWLRLRFSVSDPAFATTFQTNFSFLGSVTLSNTAIVVLSKAECPSDFIQRDVTSQCGLETQITLGGNFGSLSISAWVKFEYLKTSIVLEFNNNYSWNLIQGWLVSVLSKSSASSDTSIDPGPLLPNTSDVNFAVRKVTLVLSNPGSGSGFSLQEASILFEVTVYKAIFSLQLGWPGPSITARLWNSIVPNISTYALLPYIEPYDQYAPLGTPTAAVEFGDFCGSSITPPPGAMNLSPTFYELDLTASYDSNKQLRYRFSGTLQSVPLTSGSGVPKVVLGDLDFSLSHSQSSGYDVLLSTTLQLIPRDFPNTLASLLTVSVEYIDQGTSSSWQVIGSATNVSFATIYNLFDADASDAVMDILGTLKIPELQVVWDYSTGEASLFVSGILRVGPFELDLSYQYLHDSGQGQSAWSFHASLGSHRSQRSTLYELVQALGVDQNVLDTLADVQFVANMQIPAATPTVGSRPPVSLSITKEPGKETIFWIQIAIATSEGTLSFTYVQLQGARSSATASSPPTGFKRIIRVMLDRLPTLPGVPVVGPIPQPVDAIDYLWVGDSTVDNTTHTAGFTLSDITLINSTMSADNFIPYKNSQSGLQSNSPGNAPSANANPYVLLAGHHFLVQANGNVILDHLFGKGSAPAATPQATTLAVAPKTADTSTVRFSATPMVAASNSGAAAGPAIQADSGSTKAPLSRSIGPLTIQNVSLTLKLLK